MKKLLSVVLAFMLVFSCFGSVGVVEASAETIPSGSSGLTVKTVYSDTLNIEDLRVEYMENPIGIEETSPRFSWKLNCDAREVTQKSYRIMVASSKTRLSSGDYDIWDSGTVPSSESVGITYDGSTTFTYSSRYYWKVEVIATVGAAEKTATSTKEAYFEMGLLDDSDWQAKWIELDSQSGPENYTVEIDFKLEKEAAGIIFAASDSNNFLMWQINTSESGFNGETSFRPHAWRNGNASLISQKEISAVIPKAEQKLWHTMKIVVVGTQITTFVDDQQIDQLVIEKFAYGKLGFRQHVLGDATDEKAYYDNIVVKDSTNNILFSDDFSQQDNINFEVGEIVDNTLFVEKALGFQKVVQSAPMYRKDFTVDAGKALHKATIYTSSLGIYELELNGERVGDDFFNPGWTNYELNANDNNYVMYQTFDVTPMLQSGQNIIGAMTGHGWYSGKLFIGGSGRYGTGSKLLCQIRLDYTDGSHEIIASDTSWKTFDKGPIIANDFQGGETYNAELEQPGWSALSYNDSQWNPSVEYTYNGAVIGQVGPTVKVVEEFAPKSISKIAEGTYIVDLGQNISGFIRLNGMKADAGHTMKLRFGEMINKDGTLYTANLRSAKATDYYMFKGDPTGETWQPRFTFHGFQYVEISGVMGELSASDITGVALSSLQEQTGKFETSNPLVNKLQSNIYWGQLDNFISVPTDCPQRDERLGYTGDGQVFARTAVMNQNTGPFFNKFMMDVASNQRNDGAVADWTPNYVTPGDGASGSFGNAGWGDAVYVIPWATYSTYGDKKILEDNYDAMKNWLDYYKNKSVGLIVESSAYGDWLSTEDTNKTLITTGFFAYGSDIVSRVATVLGKDVDAAYYRQQFEDIREAFNEEFVADDGTIGNGSQTSYLLALKFDLLATKESQEKAAELLVANIRSRGTHLSTGFIGVAFLCPMLSEMGYDDVAYELLLQEGYPSWMYSVKNGATTIWERWNSYNAETGQFGDINMNSFNHYSLGSVGEWFYNYAAGITTDNLSPSFKDFIINPHIGGGFDYINASFDSVYGEIVSNWKFESEKLTMEVKVPANTTAKIFVPATSQANVMESGAPASTSQGLTFVEFKDGKAVYQAKSGYYKFTTDGYVQKYQVAIKADGAEGTASVAGEEKTLPCNFLLSRGEEVNIIATPFNDVEHYYTSWSGDATSDSNVITINPTSAMELTVHSEEIIRENIALGKTATAKTSINSGDWNILNITDGIYSSVSGHLGYTSNAIGSTVDENVTIDLGAGTALNRIHIYPRTDVTASDGTTASFPVDFEIQTSDSLDGPYITIHTEADYSAPFKKPAVFTFEELSTQYLRLQVNKAGKRPAGENATYLQLSEIGIYNWNAPLVDKTELNNLISECDNYNMEDYTENSWAVFAAAKLTAHNVANNIHVTQPQVDSAVMALSNAIGELVLIDQGFDVDKTALDALIEQCALLIEADYTVDSWTSFASALSGAKSVSDNPSAVQSEVITAKDNLVAAINQLVPLDENMVNTAVLKAELANAKKLIATDYTEESWQLVAKSIEVAELLLADNNYTQAEIDAAKDDIINAVSKLEKATIAPPINPPVDPPVLPPVTPPVTVVVPPREGASRSSGGSSIPDRSHNIPQSKAVALPLSSADAKAAFDSAVTALPQGATKIVVKVSGKATITGEIISQMEKMALEKGLPLQIVLDTIENNKVVSRFTISSPLTEIEIATTIALSNAKSYKDRSIAEKFGDSAIVADFAQQRSFGGMIKIHVKLPVELLGKPLEFYRYNPTTKLYVIETLAYAVDANGYVSFETNSAENLIICQKKI